MRAVGDGFQVDGHGRASAAVVERCLQPLGLDSAERIVIDGLTAQKRMVEADYGTGIMPRSAIAEEVRLGSLAVLDLDGFDESAPVFMLHRPNAFMNASLRQLVAVIAPGTFAGSSEACPGPGSAPVSGDPVLSYEDAPRSEM